MRSTNGWTYNEQTNKSTKLISSFVGLENTGQLAAYDNSGNQLGRYALVNINNTELPALDGSSYEYIKKLVKVGINFQNENKNLSD